MWIARSEQIQGGGTVTAGWMTEDSIALRSNKSSHFYYDLKDPG